MNSEKPTYAYIEQFVSMMSIAESLSFELAIHSKVRRVFSQYRALKALSNSVPIGMH